MFTSLKKTTVQALAVAMLCMGAMACTDENGTPLDEIPGAPPKICAAADGQAVPDTLSKTGIFLDLGALVTIDGFHEYDVIAPLWSDGALKRRWMWLPPGAKITFSPDSSWQFPDGTCFVKQFDLEVAPASAATAGKNIVHLETRVLIKKTSGWIGYSYAWNDDQADATLLADSGATKVVAVADAAASGGLRSQTWTYPSRMECLTCHSDAAGGALGPRTKQLNQNRNYAAGAENQLEHWDRQQLFGPATIGDATKLGAYVNPADNKNSGELRARSYLAANCAHCHQPGGAAAQAIDLRFETPLAQMGLVGEKPSRGSLGATNALRVDAGHKENSVLWLRMLSTDTYRMPTLGSAVVDPLGVVVVGDWIDGLGAP